MPFGTELLPLALFDIMGSVMGFVSGSVGVERGSVMAFVSGLLCVSTSARGCDMTSLLGEVSTCTITISSGEGSLGPSMKEEIKWALSSAEHYLSQ